MNTARWRGGTAAGAGAAAYALIGAVLLPMTTSLLSTATSPQAQLGQVVGLAAALASWVALLWAAVVTLLPLLAAAVCGTGSAIFRWASALGPHNARHLVAALLGAGLLGGTVGTAVPAAATQTTETTIQVAWIAPTGSPAPSIGPDLDRPALPAGDDSDHSVTLPSELAPVRPTYPSSESTLTPGWTPDRPVLHRRQPTGAARASRLVTGTVTPGRHVLDHLVVRRGDSLWDIAARHLGPDASAADIAREWPRWHHANRAVIGPDPGLLLPGQQLVAPAAC